MVFTSNRRWFRRSRNRRGPSMIPPDLFPSSLRRAIYRLSATSLSLRSLSRASSGSMTRYQYHLLESTSRGSRSHQKVRVIAYFAYLGQIAAFQNPILVAWAPRRHPYNFHIINRDRPQYIGDKLYLLPPQEHRDVNPRRRQYLGVERGHSPPQTRLT